MRLRITRGQKGSQFARWTSNRDRTTDFPGRLLSLDVIHQISKLLRKLTLATARGISGNLQGHGRKMLSVPLAVAFQQRFDLFGGRHLTLRVLTVPLHRIQS